MLEQLVITLREGVEAALIVAIAVAYLRKIGRADLFRVVYAALAAAVLVSAAGAIAITRLHWNEDRFEGWLMLVAGVFVATMVYWMARTARHMRREIEERIERILGASSVALFLFIFFMVLREGVETVLILSAVSLNTSELLGWLGAVAGLALAVLFGVAFVKGSVRINLQRFFRVTGIILVFIAVQLFITGVHELSEAGVLHSSKEEMALIGPIVRNDVFFFVVILGLTGVLLIRERLSGPGAGGGTSGASGGTSSTAAPAASQRKTRWYERQEKLWSTLAYVSSFAFIVLITAHFIYLRSVRAAPVAVAITPSAGFYRLPVTEVNDGNLHVFSAVTPKGPVRFFAIRRPTGDIALALDACQICGSFGYYQQGQQIHCRNCDAPINIESVGQEGGCNPIPFVYRQAGNEVVIPEAALEPNAALFAHQ